MLQSESASRAASFDTEAAFQAARALPTSGAPSGRGPHPPLVTPAGEVVAATQLPSTFYSGSIEPNPCVIVDMLSVYVWCSSPPTPDGLLLRNCRPASPPSGLYRETKPPSFPPCPAPPTFTGALARLEVLTVRYGWPQENTGLRRTEQSSSCVPPAFSVS